MRGTRVACRFLTLLMAVVALGLSARAETLIADGEGAGDVWATFTEHGLTATLEGDVSWVGRVQTADGIVSYTAAGSFCGLGVHDLITSTTEGWLAFDAEGVTADGDAIVLRGLLILSHDGERPLRAGETVGGTLYAVLAIVEQAAFFVGGFRGAAVAEVVPSDAAWTLQLQGGATAHLTGERVEATDALLSSIPLDHPALTSDFLDHTRALFEPYVP